MVIKIIDKNSLFDGVSIGKFLLCVNQKMITRCGVVPGVKLLGVLMRDYKGRIRGKRYA